ncbi:MAG: hypothetical protein ACREQO_23925, partial [Candidatus Binatia bacterium]
MKRRFFRRLTLAALVVVSLTAEVRSAQKTANETIQTAALGLPTGPSADWRQWDSFFTNVVKKLAGEFSPALREQLAETFLDSRYQLTRALDSGSSDPVPQLLIDGWKRLAP